MVGTRRGLRGDPALFHEYLCRQSFLQKPVPSRHGTGIDAERAILTGGTLSNGQLQVQMRDCHGVRLRELIPMRGYKPGAIVTCYGGFVGLAPPKGEHHTHMRQIPTTNYVLDGEEFSDCFPFQNGAVFGLGHTLAMTPRCENRAWEDIIRSTGLGYMANTITKCPLQRRARTNVTVHTAVLGRSIPGVPYSTVVYLRAGTNGIQPQEPIISPYEGCQSKQAFQFICADEDHYHAAGREFVSIQESQYSDCGS